MNINSNWNPARRTIDTKLKQDNNKLGSKLTRSHFERRDARNTVQPADASIGLMMKKASEMSLNSAGELADPEQSFIEQSAIEKIILQLIDKSIRQQAREAFIGEQMHMLNQMDVAVAASSSQQEFEQNNHEQQMQTM